MYPAFELTTALAEISSAALCIASVVLRIVHPCYPNIVVWLL